MIYKIYPLIFIAIFAMIISTINAEGINMPEIHGKVALQSEFYAGGEIKPGDVFYQDETEEKFSVREVTLEFKGELHKNIEYGIEVGSVTCPMNPGGNFQIMEAMVLYKIIDWMKVGYMKGHILRGFEMQEECTGLLTAEKPYFTKMLLSGVCHPTGAVLEVDYDFSDISGIETQFAILNQNASLEKVYDMNLGAVYLTPLQGLSIGGYYNPINLKLFNPDWTQSTRFGYRTGAGLDYDCYNIVFRGEYYTGKAFNVNTNNLGVEPKDLEMEAYYIQAGYRFNTGWNNILYVQPYIQYQYWDRASNVDMWLKYKYIVGGITIGLGENTKLKINYETPYSTPDYEPNILFDNPPDIANRLIVRLQTGF